jgi:CRP/FNR family transcriptional regulator, cyclic AMP receptor protein
MLLLKLLWLKKYFNNILEQDVKYWYLRNHKLFRNLSNSDIKDLCIWSGMQRAGKNDLIYLQEAPHRIYILKKGVIKIIGEDANGNEVTKDFITEGDIFGELNNNFDDNNETVEVAQVASKEVIICSFLVEDFEALLLKKPDLGITYSKWIGFKLSKLRMRYSNLVQKDVKSRLKYFFKQWASQNGELINGVTSVKNYLTQKDIAGIIGATRQTVVTTLTQMEQDGELTYSREYIMLHDKILE